MIYLLIPLLNGVFALLLVYLMVAMIRNKVHSFPFEEEAEKLLHDKVKEVVENLKNDIPLASTFMTGSFQQRLEKKIGGQVLKMVPSLKKVVIEKMNQALQKAPLLMLLAFIGGALLGVLELLLLIE